MEIEAIRRIESDVELEDALALPSALLFKHSNRCGSSLRGLLQVERFARETPGFPVFIIDVIRQRDLSRRVAERLGVDHESPQAILVEGGKPTWHASHSSITTASLLSAMPGGDG